MAFLDLVGVSKQYGQATVVSGFDLNAAQGEFVSFLGPSGCGKTTTLRMIAGFEVPTAGTITVNGVDITRRSPNQRNVGMVFQSYALFPNMTVAQNIEFGLRLRKTANQQSRRRVAELLELIALPDLGHRYPYQLSGGQQQRVALARALAIEPQVLLLDEPLSALDAKIRVSLRNEIRAIQRQLGITTIYVTHDQEEALSLSDRVVVMSAGRIEQTGTPFQIYNFPETAFVASFVGTLNVLKATVIDPATGRIGIDGQEIKTRRPLADRCRGDEISVALRPEVISLDGQPGTTNRLRGTVEEATFLGAVVRARVRFSSEIVHFDTFNSPDLVMPQRGQQVSLTFPSEAVLILGDESTRREPPVAKASLTRSIADFTS